MEKPLGSRGSWFATWRGEKIPCVHAHWTKRMGDHLAYRDPGYADGNPRFGPLVAALKRDGKAILTSGDVTGDSGRWGKMFKRTGYIALYRVTNVRIGDNALCFDFVHPPLDRFS